MPVAIRAVITVWWGSCFVFDPFANRVYWRCANTIVHTNKTDVVFIFNPTTQAYYHLNNKAGITQCITWQERNSKRIVVSIPSVLALPCLCEKAIEKHFFYDSITLYINIKNFIAWGKHLAPKTLAKLSTKIGVFIHQACFHRIWYMIYSTLEIITP